MKDNASEILDAFFILARDESRCAYQKMAPLWMEMAYLSIPLWKRLFYQTRSIKAMTVKGMLNLMLDHERWRC